MGLLSRIFGSKDVESVKEIESELVELKKESRCDIISFIGLSGRLKGLPLIYQADDENKLKQVTAHLIEFFPALSRLTLGEELEKFNVEFDKKSIFFREITNKVGFFALASKFEHLTEAEDWLKDNYNSIYNIFLVK